MWPHPRNVLWHQRQLRIKGKAGSHGKRAKVRVVPMSPRVRTLLEHHFALEKAFPVKVRHTALQEGISLPTVQKILGHDRLATTAIYLNFTDVHIQDEFERKW